MRQGASLPLMARRAAAELGRRVGLSEARISEIELGVTEAAVNLNNHAVNGALLLRLVEVGGAAVELLAIDSGPGMADIIRARRSGVSSTGTLGIGLGVMGRMADDFEICSVMGRGTVLVARFRARHTDTVPLPALEPIVTGLTRPMSGETVCGDAWAVRSTAGGTEVSDPSEGRSRSEGAGADGSSLVMLCDGLGHGPLAALAGEQAVAAFHRSSSTDPREVVGVLHRAMAGTRGGAVAVAKVDHLEQRVGFCGVGNISAFIVADDKRSTLLSAPGIVGHQLPKLRSYEFPLPAGASLVLHSDGLTERWSPGAMPGLFGRQATVIAAHLLREAGVRRDDAGVVVVKGGSVGRAAS